MKDGLITRLGRKAAPYLLAGSIFTACSKDNVLSPEIVQECPINKKELSLWFNRAGAVHELEEIVNYKQGKLKSSPRLASSSFRKGDHDNDNNYNTPDIIRQLDAFHNGVSEIHKYDMNSNGIVRADTNDLFRLVGKVLSDYDIIYPSSLFTLPETIPRNRSLILKAESIDDSEMSYKWLVDNKLYSTRDTTISLPKGIHTIKLITADASNKDISLNNHILGFIDKAQGNANALEKAIEVTGSVYTITGQHFDNDTEQGVKATITVNGNEYQTDDAGNFTIEIPDTPLDSIVITAKQENGFKRKEKHPEADINLKVYSVSYPTTCPDQEFIDFVEEANFTDYGLFYYGLKSMLRNPEAEFWIASHYEDGARATREDQEHIKNKIINEMYPYIKPEFRPKIYLENPDSLETIPRWQYGKIVVVPAYEGFGIGWKDNNKDGIIDNIRVYLTAGWWRTDWAQSSIDEELWSALISGNDVNDEERTVLDNYGSLTEKDQKLINIIQRYDPLERRDNILGL